MIRTGLLFVFVIMISIGNDLNGQGFNLGIRAGLAQSKFIGPVETGTNESFGMTNGFHFGINFQWNFSEVIGLRTEILYNQNGSTYNMETPNGFYIFNDAANGISNKVFRAESKVKLDHSNAYFQMPQTVNFRLSNKFEVFGGAYVAFLLSPVATGTIQFGGNDLNTEHSFEQGLNFNYSSDPNIFSRPAQILIRVEGENVDLSTPVDSRAFWNNGITESRIKSVDYGLIGGASYYLNRGLYIMGRVEYGLNDVTRNSADYSFANLNDDETLQFKNDFDRNLSFQLSIGFKF